VRPFYFIAFILFSSFCHDSAAGFTVTLIDKDRRPLPNMVVYAQPQEAMVLPASDKVVEIGQRDRAFTPYINVMQLGNSVSFQNGDDITHHIYSPIGKNKFSLRIRAGQSQSKSDFQQLGEVAMGCNIHDWMSGYLYIVDTPLFGKSDARGNVVLNIEQSGGYRLVVWHPQLEVEGHSVSQQIEWPNLRKTTIVVPHAIAKISKQKSEEDFDFLSDY